jgi:hypothetical protein
MFGHSDGAITNPCLARRGAWQVRGRLHHPDVSVFAR